VELTNISAALKSKVLWFIGKDCMTHRFFLLVVISFHFFLNIPTIRAQQSENDKQMRFHFATMYVGVDAQYLPYLLDHSEPSLSEQLPMRLTPRLTIGGLHFWGHADFYLAFPIPPSGIPYQIGPTRTFYSTGVETGMHFFPWKVQQHTLIPFVGAAWSILNYAEEYPETSGPTIIKHELPLEAGLTWLSGPLLLEIGGMWLPRTSIDYPISREEKHNIKLEPFTFWLGMKYLFDVTAPRGFAYTSGLVDTLERELASSGKLNSFSIAIGPSSAFPLSSSSYNKEDRPYLEDQLPAAIFPDVSIGYYRHDLDAAINLSYRPITQSQTAFEVGQELSRQVISLEVMKFLFDYNGFVPFVGATLNHDDLQVIESDNGVTVTKERKSVWSPGVIFGWDIRPTRIDWFLLRTNLRYNPGAELELKGKKIAFDQLEFNFIQFVFYPNRLF